MQRHTSSAATAAANCLRSFPFPALEGPVHPCASRASAKPSDPCTQVLLKTRGTAPVPPAWVSRHVGQMHAQMDPCRLPQGVGAWRTEDPLLQEPEFGSGQNQAAPPRAQTERAGLYSIPLIRFRIDQSGAASSVCLDLASGVSKESPAPGAPCTLLFCLSQRLHPRTSES